MSPAQPSPLSNPNPPLQPGSYRLTRPGLHCALAWIQGDSISSGPGSREWVTGATGLCILAQPPFPKLRTLT